MDNLSAITMQEVTHSHYEYTSARKLRKTQVNLGPRQQNHFPGIRDHNTMNNAQGISTILTGISPPLAHMPFSLLEDTNLLLEAEFMV